LKSYGQKNKILVKNQVLQKVTLASLAEGHNSPVSNPENMWRIF